MTIFGICCLSALSLLFLGISSVEGGVCWATLTPTGRCQDIIQTQMDKAACCKLGGGLAAWTGENYDNGQIFFWNALGGGAPNCQSCSVSCDNIQCPEGEVCSVRSGHARCGCPTVAFCNGKLANLTKAEYVCAANGMTFKSACHLQRHNCQKHTKHWLDYQGPCQHSCETVKCRADQQCIVDSDHDPHCVRCMSRCPDIFSPMCGTDGVTYDSMCHLHKAACEDRAKNLKYAYRGACNTGTSCKDARCAAEEVCVTDNQNNIPRCVRCDLNCSSSDYSPVCGSDGVTYTNWCQLRQNSCSFGVLIHVEKMGACEVSEKKWR